MIDKVINYFRTGADQPLRDLSDPSVRSEYAFSRWSVFLSTTIGYGFFYTCRLSLSVAKKPMLDAKILTPYEMGKIGFILLFVYAFGKFCNGFLADHSNIRRFMSSALLASAIVNILFGFQSLFWSFMVLWAINGWVQSIGSAPSVVSLCQWFSNKERGTRYGIWAASHSIGEGLTFVGTATLVATFGWRWGFWGPGIICVIVALVMFKTMRDRPQTYGLPHVSEYTGDHSAGLPSNRSIGSLQIEVLKSPIIWALGLSCATMYMARYAMNSWGILYLQEAKGYELIEAGSVLAFYPIAGLFGASLCGIISDKIFDSKRNLPTLLYGLLLISSMILFFYGSPEDRIQDIIAVSMFGFAIGGLIVFLAGLIALDAFSKKAAGAVKGVLGLFSYLGAALQDWVSGSLITAGQQTQPDGSIIYHFDSVIIFWVGSAIVSVILAMTVWNIQARE